MKQTKKTKQKLMFKQDDERLIFEKTDEGIKIEIGKIEADKQTITLANMFSIIAWMNDLELVKS